MKTPIALTSRVVALRQLTPIVILSTALVASAQQASPLVVQHDLPYLYLLGNPGAGFPQLKLELRVPANDENDPPVVKGDLTIGMFDSGSSQQGIFQLNNNGSSSSWTWQSALYGDAPHVHMNLTAAGTLRLFGNGADSIVLRPSIGEGLPGVYVNGSRLVLEADLINSVLPQIQTVTMHVDEALSLGAVSGIIGTGSMAAGAGASVYGSGSLAFGANSHVGTALTSTGQLPSGAVVMASNAVALGKDSNARGDGAMAFGTRANAATRQGIAIGEDSEASGGVSFWWQAGYDWGSVAVGTRAKALGSASAAFGLNTYAYASESVAIGPRAVTWPGAAGSIAMGWGTSSARPNSIAIGNMAYSNEIGGISLGSMAYSNGVFSAAIGSFTEAIGAGMIAVGTAPDFTGLTANANWDDMNSVVFIVGGGKRGDYIGGTGGWSLSDFAVTRRTPFSVTRGGNVKASGKIEASKAGGIKVPDTLEAKDGVTRLQGVVILERQGDISMGTFVSGPQP